MLFVLDWIVGIGMYPVLGLVLNLPVDTVGGIGSIAVER